MDEDSSPFVGFGIIRDTSNNTSINRGNTISQTQINQQLSENIHVIGGTTPSHRSSVHELQQEMDLQHQQQ